MVQALCIGQCDTILAKGVCACCPFHFSSLTRRSRRSFHVCVLQIYESMRCVANRSGCSLNNVGRFGRVIITARDADPNLLRREVFEELRILDGIIQNTTAVYDGEEYTYEDICARWDDACFSNDILNLDQIMDEVRVTTISCEEVH